MNRWALTAAFCLLLATAGCGGDSGADSRQSRTMTIELGKPTQSGDGGARRPGNDSGRPPQLPGDDSCADARQPASGGSLRQAEIAIRCLTNAARAQKGLPALRFDERLARAAADRSQAMVEANFFGHNGPGPSSARSEVRDTGWIPRNRSWLLGENIGSIEGRATPAEMVRSWLDSPRHRANIMNEHFAELGVGAVAGVPRPDAGDGATFTQIFGATGEAARRAQTR